MGLQCSDVISLYEACISTLTDQTSEGYYQGGWGRGTLLLRKWAQSLHKMFVVIGIIASNLAANIKTQTVHIHAEYTTLDLKHCQRHNGPEG